VLVVLTPGDHVDEVAPGQAAWAEVADTIVALALGGRTP